MKELNQAVYYTTAQVTELVDLSDQNVRKYVRLLEDRKYEVAKDEHNRRLFSANDVLILRELITKAKKPGYTLESAADDIVDEVGEIISASGHGVAAVSNDNDIKEMFAHVIERLDAIQDENKDLKDNIRNLVERLEHYDQYSSQRYLESSAAEEHNVDYNATETTVNTDSGKRDEEMGNNTDEDIDEYSEGKEVQTGQSIDEAPSVSENSAENNIDMNEYSQGESESEDKQDGESQKNTQPIDQNEEDKEGFFSSLFKMFKK